MQHMLIFRIISVLIYHGLGLSNTIDAATCEYKDANLTWHNTINKAHNVESKVIYKGETLVALWPKGHEPIEYGRYKGRLTMIGENDIKIMNATRSDSGAYKQILRLESINNASEALTTLEVIVAPKDNCIPNIKRAEDTLWAQLDEDDCGIPRLIPIWKNAEHTIVNGNISVLKPESRLQPRIYTACAVGTALQCFEGNADNLCANSTLEALHPHNESNSVLIAGILVPIILVVGVICLLYWKREYIKRKFCCSDTRKTAEKTDVETAFIVPSATGSGTRRTAEETDAETALIGPSATGSVTRRTAEETDVETALIVPSATASTVESNTALNPGEKIVLKREENLEEVGMNVHTPRDESAFVRKENSTEEMSADQDTSLPREEKPTAIELAVKIKLTAEKKLDEDIITSVCSKLQENVQVLQVNFKQGIQSKYFINLKRIEKLKNGFLRLELLVHNADELDQIRALIREKVLDRLLSAFFHDQCLHNGDGLAQKQGIGFQCKLADKHFYAAKAHFSGISSDSGDSDETLSNGFIEWDFSKFNTVSSRLETFKNWPSNNHMKPKDLAEAGFFYQGDRDSVICFSCRGKLDTWAPNDDAWEEHKEKYPSCEHVKSHTMAGQGDVRSDETGGIQDVQSSGDTTQEEQHISNNRDDNPPEDRPSMCRTCQREIACMVLIPCGHMVACRDCAKCLIKCTQCQKQFLSSVKAFSAWR